MEKIQYRQIVEYIKADPSSLGMHCFSAGITAFAFWRRLAQLDIVSDEEYDTLLESWTDMLCERDEDE